MSSRQESSAKVLATKENALIVLQGARNKLSKGWNKYYDAMYKGQSTVSTSCADSWSIAGAIGSSAQENNLGYFAGCYELLDLVDNELAKTLGYHACCWHPQSQYDVVDVFNTTIERLSLVLANEYGW